MARELEKGGAKVLAEDEKTAAYRIFCLRGMWTGPCRGT